MLQQFKENKSYCPTYLLCCNIQSSCFSDGILIEILMLSAFFLTENSIGKLKNDIS